jgi:translocator assembly and maintenance protein 41
MLQHVGAGVFFHPLVQLNRRRLIKYGVIEHECLIEDLVSWKHLYVAGRLQKPTVLITDNDSQTSSLQLQEFKHAQNNINLPAALTAALLCIDKHQTNNTNMSIPESVLYQRIAQLSYSGDVRMNVSAEDPNKIQKLVESQGQFERFRLLYRESFERIQQHANLTISSDDADGTIVWDTSNAETVFQKFIPNHIQELCQNDPNRLKHVLQHDIVSPATTQQTIKGVFTAGIGRSMKYAAAKLIKGGWLGK